ncbi:UDP-glycosyltransferase 85A1-like [Selaginella moellendorffii]|uniref:UDP-glycosyltransferase 85A1-like n=1 Tax=Selaginella moellendorffii TaxID=88036 RepID=UPI000D1C2FE7|nr:UDP-glycosyltransferase 85A1-like [Selaginella moellendorffii]|eukprot:XP_024536324.1 UDP-glycosyltransferase 85A1-like [Selaginella moellendorffii]
MDEVSNPSNRKRPHAVAIALPVQGHINPMMQLATKMASRGCIVTLVNLQSNHRRLVEASDPVKNIRFESVPDRVPVDVASMAIFGSTENRKTFRKAYEAMEEDVMELLQNKLLQSDCPVSFIIGDVYLNWVVRVADAVGLPRLLFSTTCASSLLVDHWIPRLLETGEIPIETGMDKEVLANLPGMPRPLRKADLPFYFTSRLSTPDSFSRRYAKAKSLRDCDGILINSADFLEPGAFKALQSEVNSNTIGVGPLLDTAGKSTTNAAWVADAKCLDWLNGREEKSVLYVSFGSLATLPCEQVLEMAEGIKQCGYSVLWVLRPNLLGSTGEDSQESLKTVLEEIEASGKACLVDWAPQLQVLAHAAVGGFLSHCGWNSVLEAVWFGIPVLAWPQIVEQSLVARIACGEWKVGMRVPVLEGGGGVIDRTRISQCIDGFMMEGELGRNCRALQMVVKASDGLPCLNSFFYFV